MRLTPAAVLRFTLSPAVAIVSGWPVGVAAHGGHDLATEALGRWTWDPLVLAALAVSAAIYVTGLRRLWAHAGREKGVRMWRAAAYAAGLSATAIALVSPVAWLSQVLFSVHMTQHEILMLVAAPLIVLGQPLVVALWTLQPRARERVAAITHLRFVVRAWRAVTGPLSAFLIHAAVLWVWHIPSFYEAALASRSLHIVQHVCFLFTAALFWWAMAHGRYGRACYGVAVLYVFLTAVHSSVLGALMTISPGLWYPSYARTSARWSVDALQDQQLAGLLMWIPASVIFIVAGLGLFAAWLGESERNARLGSAPSSERPGSGTSGSHLPRRLPVVLLLVAAFALPACESRVHRDARAPAASRGCWMDAIGKYGCGRATRSPACAARQGTSALRWRGLQTARI